MIRVLYIVSPIRKTVHIAFLAACLSLGGLAHAQHQCKGHVRGMHSYENPLNDQWLSAFDVKSYVLDLSVSNQNTEISGTAILYAEATRPLDTLVLELQDALKVSQVLSLPESRELEYEHSGGVLFMFMERTYVSGELLSVEISYGGEAGGNAGFFTGITSASDYEYGFDVTYTLSEPQNARNWFPVKQVLEDKIDSLTAIYRCNEGLMVGSNGLLVDHHIEGKESVYTWKTSYPMAYYLHSFSVADYRDFSFKAPLRSSGDSVLVQNFIYDSDELLEEEEENIRMTADLITTFSELLVDYPFAREKYGHCMAPLGGGMEHQTMTTIANFNFYLVAHELAHQWFGDHITCGNWQDIWINEGFASYFEYIAAQEIYGQDFADNWMDQAMSIALGETRGSVFVPEEYAENAYRVFDTGLSYKKGAILLHMIRYIVDDDEFFFRILGTFLKEYAGTVAIAEDFRAVLERESAKDFGIFFEQWYYGEGFPRFSLHWEQMGDSLLITSEQGTSAPDITPLFQVPFELEVLLVGGEKRRIKLEQVSAEEHFSIYLPKERVETILFDPDNWLLNESQIMQLQSYESPFRYGPNPVSAELFVQSVNSDRIQLIRITNLSGSQLLQLEDVDNPVLLDLSAFANGTYLLEMDSDRGSHIERIIKASNSIQLP